MIQNQKSNCTIFNRYPEIFKEIKEIIPSPNNILSFGCSTGQECETLHKLYFPNSKIIGLDICDDIITDNKKKNKYNYIEYYSKFNNITEKNDIIFANSVLCRWPETSDEYTFDTFEKTLEIIDSLLNVDGYLCIYNSKYIFSETNLFINKYEKINTLHKNTGYVTKYDKNNNKINNNYPFFLFKKIKI